MVSVDISGIKYTRIMDESFPSCDRVQFSSHFGRWNVTEKIVLSLDRHNKKKIYIYYFRFFILYILM